MGNLIVTEPTPRLIRIWENYGGKKSGSTTDVKAFDNFDHNNITGIFYANNEDLPARYAVDVKRVSEQEFIDIMGLVGEDKNSFKIGDIVVVTDVDIQEQLWKEGEVVSMTNGCSTVRINGVSYVLDNSSIILKSEFKDNPQNKQSGKKESEGKLNYELDFSFIEQMGLRMSKNTKYPPYNWQLPMKIEGLKQALFRHVMEVMKGNYDDDGETLAHFHAIATNAMMIHYQLKHFKDETKGNN